MAQIKIYGHAEFLDGRRTQISEAIHRAARQTLGLPEHKRFHRFFPLRTEDFVHPADRGLAYLILEIHLFQGRTPQTLSAFIRAIQKEMEGLAVAADDLEITLIETPAAHWGIRGRLGNELQLSYEVNT